MYIHKIHPSLYKRTHPPLVATSFDVMPPFAIRNRGRTPRSRTTSTSASETAKPVSSPPCPSSYFVGGDIHLCRYV